MNQIEENVACNSDYYNNIIEKNPNFGNVIRSIVDELQFKVDPKHNKTFPIQCVTTTVLSVPILDIKSIETYFHISTTPKTNNTLGSKINIEYKYDETSCGKNFCISINLKIVFILKNVNYTLNTRIHYNGFDCFVMKIFKKNNVQYTVVGYKQTIFHFTFHSKNYFEKGICLPVPWNIRGKGAFHVKINCVKHKNTPANSSLTGIDKVEQPYLPIIFANPKDFTIKRNKEERFFKLDEVWNSENKYSSFLTYHPYKRPTCPNKITVDVQLLSKSPFPSKPEYEFVFHGIDYITDIVAPIYDYIIDRLNHSIFALPTQNKLHLDLYLGMPDEDIPANCENTHKFKKCRKNPANKLANLKSEINNEIIEKNKNKGGFGIPLRILTANENDASSLKSEYKNDMKFLRDSNLFHLNVQTRKKKSKTKVKMNKEKYRKQTRKRIHM